MSTRRTYIKPQSAQGQIELRGGAAFFVEAVNHEWSVFHPLTPDIGIDYVIAKGYCAVMVQFKTATLMGNNRYHVSISKFLEGPLGYIVYYFQGVNAFFLIPSVDYWEIRRFKDLKQRVFEMTKPYPDTMSYEIAKSVMGDYEGEKGWTRLEELTKPDGLLQAIKEFVDKQR